MPSSSSEHKDHSVFDFGRDDEIIQSASRELLVKFVNKGENVQQTEIKNASSVAFNEKCADKSFNNISNYAVGTSERDFSFQEETSGLNIVVSTLTNDDEHVRSSQDKLSAGNLITGCMRIDSLDMGGLSLGNMSLCGEQLDCSPPELPSDQEVISDEDGSMEASSLPHSTSDIAENDGATSVRCFGGYENLEKTWELTILPDFVLYRDGVATCSQLTFTLECVKCDDLTVVGSDQSYNLRWETDDIVHLQSRWSPSSETCLAVLQLGPNAVVGFDDVPNNSGFKKLTFTFFDPRWGVKEQMFTSFSSRFKDKWNPILNRMNKEDEFSERKLDMFFLRRYFTNSDEAFEDVVYPKGDPDAVSISKRDVELLQPETFVNDTIIDFYIKYLNNKIQPKDKHRFHFFNSFFFRKLADLDKDPGSALEGKAAFQRVRKWTRKVNIFEKDFIFIPVNYNLHWSLIVICHPGDIFHFTDERVDNNCKVPCILHMDSIKGSHSGLKNLIQSYLCEEWKARHESSEDISHKFSNLRFIPLELPQQENSFDCGLFLLHYVELFLEDAPVNFSPFKITKFCNFLNMDWFPPVEASQKRSTIQKLIYELLDDQHQKNTPACTEQSKFSERVDTGKERVEYLSEKCSPQKKICTDDFLSSTVGATKRTLLSLSDEIQYDKGMGTVLQDFLEQGTIAGSFSTDCCQPGDQTVSSKKQDISLLPSEDDAETAAKYVHADRFDQVQSGCLDEPCGTSCSVKDGETLQMSCFQENLRQASEHCNKDASSDLTICLQSSIPKIVAMDHDSPLPIKRPRSGSAEICGVICDSPDLTSADLKEELVVENSLERDHDKNVMAESKESGDAFSCQENYPAASCQDFESVETDSIPDAGMTVSRTDLEDSSEFVVHKRLKLEALTVELTD